MITTITRAWKRRLILDLIKIYFLYIVALTEISLTTVECTNTTIARGNAPLFSRFRDLGRRRWRLSRAFIGHMPALRAVSMIASLAKLGRGYCRRAA